MCVSLLCVWLALLFQFHALAILCARASALCACANPPRVFDTFICAMSWSACMRRNPCDATTQTEPDNFPRLMELMQDMQEHGQVWCAPFGLQPKYAKC